MRKIIGGALLAALTAGAGATTVTYSSFPPNPGVLPGGGFQYTQGTTFAQPTGPRMWVNGVYGGVREFRPTQVATVMGPAGAALGATATTRIGLGAGVAAIGRCLLGGGPICAAGSAAAAAYGAYRAYRAANLLEGQYSFPNVQIDPDELMHDPGIGQTGTLTPCYHFGGSQCFPSLIAAATARLPVYGYEEVSVSSVTCGPLSQNQNCPGNTIVNFSWKDTSAPGGRSSGWRGADWLGRGMDALSYKCPASVDPFDPAQSVPEGTPVGIDGKCKTARYHHQPKNIPELQQIIEANPPTFPDPVWKDALRDAIDTGGETVPGDMTITGPVSQTGPSTTTTTTGPSGTTTSTEAPVYNYTYNDNRVTWNITTTNTSTSAGGTTTTTTNAPNPEIKTCGYPGGPKCAIDETGTPNDKGTAFTGPAADIVAKTAEIGQKITDAGNRTSLPWAFPLSVPVGSCTPVPTWAPSGQATIWFDPCTPVGVAIFRALMGWWLAVMVGWHIWETAVEARR